MKTSSRNGSTILSEELVLKQKWTIEEFRFNEDFASFVKSLQYRKEAWRGSILIFHFNTITEILSVIRQKDESQNECFKKTKHAKFSEKRTRALFSWNTGFEIRPFALLPTTYEFTRLNHLRPIYRFAVC